MKTIEGDTSVELNEIANGDDKMAAKKKAKAAEAGMNGSKNGRKCSQGSEDGEEPKETTPLQP
jgi:hypothetical protein